MTTFRIGLMVAMTALLSSCGDTKPTGTSTVAPVAAPTSAATAPSAAASAPAPAAAVTAPAPDPAPTPTPAAAPAPVATAAVAASPAPAAVAGPEVPPLPETLLLIVVKGLQSDDFVSIFKALPPVEQQQIQDAWKNAAWTPTQTQNLDAMLAKELAPDAVDTFMAEKKDQITGLDLAGMAQKLGMGSAMIPMLLAQGGPLTPDQQNLLPLVQTLLSDIGIWLPTSGLNDPVKVRQAAVQAQAAVKALGVTTSAQLQALPFTEVLTRLGLAHHELKSAFLPFGLHADKLFASVTATSVQDKADNPLHRILTVSYTAFGHPSAVPLPVIYQNHIWRIDPLIVPASLAQIGGSFAPTGP